MGERWWSKAKGKLKGAVKEMAKHGSNPDHKKMSFQVIARLLQGAGGGEDRQTGSRAMTNINESSGKAKSPWARATLQP